MIGQLRGTLVDRTLRGELVVEVGGVGYRATVSPSTAVTLGDIGATVVVHTHLHVREDALTLYAFATRAERDCFEALIGAHGVGPALALAILSVHSPVELQRVVGEGDVEALTLVPGVGPKTAARLLIELKARLDIPDLDFEIADDGDGIGGGAAAARADVRAALAGLGYDPEEVRLVLRELPGSGSVDDLLRGALKLLGASR